MSKQSILSTLLLAVSLQWSVAAPWASATKLNAPPLPHDRDSKDFADAEEVVVPSSASLFKRRPDYRETEKQKKEDAVEAAKKADEAKQEAIKAALRARQDQVDAYKKQLQVAIDANNNAVALGKQGRWQEAIDAHEKAVQYDSRNKQFRINLSAARTAYGQQKMSKGDYSGAAGLFRKALSSASDNGLAGKLLAECMKKSGLDPGSADVRLMVGDQLATASDFDGALVEYTAAMQLESSARTYIKMGDMSYRYGQISQATNWYRQAIIKDPDCGAAHRQLGFLAIAQKDYTSAAASLRKALILDSKDTAAATTLVDIWRKQVAANPSSAENHLGLAGALQLSGEFGGAADEYRKLQAIDPKNSGLETGVASLSRAINHAKAEHYKQVSTTLFNQGLRKEALGQITQAVMIEPRNASYQFLLGESLEAAGDYQGAHQAYLTSVLIDPENNKEAAARMKAMQSGMSAAQVNQAANQAANQAVGRAHAQAQAVSAQAPSVQMQPSASDIPASAARKNMFEGGSGSTAIPSPLNFRTHDEDSVQPATPIAAAIPAQAQPVDSFSKITEAESQKNYNDAASLLKQLLNSNLQNADIHHRLAVNLMSNGEISEAISEFRIASALSPSKKAYAEDLARAMSIHKRSMTSDGVSGVTQ